MAQLSAYSLLEGFERKTEIEILSYKPECFQNIVVFEIDPVPQNFNQISIIRDPFLSQHYHTGNSFIQFTVKDVNTYIANLGAPFSPTINCNSMDNQDEIFKYATKHLQNYESLTAYEIEHNRYIVSVSYNEKLGAFAISSSGQTIICEHQDDVDSYSSPMHERPRKVATQFFRIYNRFNNQEKQSFAKDLINRSLVGYRGFNVLEWFAIVEHYGDQRMLPVDIVEKFLRFYRLEIAPIVQTPNVTKANFASLHSRLYNKEIPAYHDLYRGTTVYFWNQQEYIGCCFVPCKYYEILTSFRRQLFNKESKKPMDIYLYLKNFKLSESETDFFSKYTDFMYEQWKSGMNNDEFSQSTNLAFNQISKTNLLNPEQQSEKLGLSQCIKSTIIIIIPIGIKGMGYDELCAQITKNCYNVSIIHSVNEINENHSLFLFDQPCTLKQLNEINSQCKRLPYQTKTIALQPECTHQYLIKDKQRFPFSFKFIMFCFLSVLEDKQAIKDIIIQLKQFEFQELRSLPTDITILCRYMPPQREKDDLYSEIVEQDFEAALNSQNDQLIESLQQYKEAPTNETNLSLKEEAKIIIDMIEKETRIRLRKRAVQFSLKKPQQQYQGLFIDRPDWEQIDNFIIDCLQIITKQYQNDSRIQLMYQTLKGQLFQKQRQVFERETKPYMTTNKLIEKTFDVEVSLAIIIPDGIVILQPQDLGLGLLQDIPVYSHTIDVVKSSKISSELQKDIRRMLKQNVEKETVLLKEIDLFHKNLNAYIVKFLPIKIKLVGKIVN